MLPYSEQQVLDYIATVRTASRQVSDPKLLERLDDLGAMLTWVSQDVAERTAQTADDLSWTKDDSEGSRRLAAYLHYPRTGGVPGALLNRLFAAWAQWHAYEDLVPLPDRMHVIHGATDKGLVSFGADSTGVLVAWLWKTGRKAQLWVLLNELLLSYGEQNRLIDHEEPATVDELLRWNNAIFSFGLSRDETDALIAEARAELAKPY